jgi:hypothetical protein
MNFNETTQGMEQVISPPFGVWNIMRPCGKNASEIGRAWGKESQAVRRNERLAAALEYGAARSVESTLIFEVRTFNPLSGQRHLLELKHELRNGADRFYLYIDGKRQRNQWSRSGFVCWMFNKIESVRVGWE